MKNSSLMLLAVPLLLAGALLVCCQMIGGATAGEAGRQALMEPARQHIGEYVLSGPYSHENLSLFLVHGDSRLPDMKILTLQEAMAQQKVVVYETGSVGELAIENVAGDVSVFIMSGDIVKGGRQDRTIKFDIILPPRCGRVPLQAHCVESGRWQRRGAENDAEFTVSTKMLASKDGKLGNRMSGRGGGQNAVWSAVEAYQDKLEASLNKPVRSPESATSLQLTLEDEDLKGAIQAYQDALRGIVDGKPDVIGYAFAINGEMNSADVFGSSQLFHKVWPRLLEAAVTEAVSERRAGRLPSPASLQDARALFESIAGARTVAQPVTARVRQIAHESEDAVMFETEDKEHDGAWVRRNYIRK